MEANGADTLKYNRLKPVIVSISIQLCMGIANIWSIFQSYLIITKATPDALFNWPATYGTLAFSLLLGFLGVGGIIGGLIQKRLSMRYVLIASGVFTGLGFFLAQFTTEATPWLLWLSYGVLGGLGMGIAYSNTISCCQKWFPDKKGLITGIIISALGFGGILFTPLTEYLISVYGVLDTFGILGVIIIAVGIVGSFFIKNPPEGFKPKGWTPPPPKHGQIIRDFNLNEAMHTPQFYIVAIALMCATSAGTMVLPMTKIVGLQPGSGLTEEAAIAGVMVISIFNSFSRIICGAISDKIGTRNTLLLLFAITVAAMVALAFAHSYAILLLIGTIGFTFGGFHTVFPVLSSEFWGTKNNGIIYGIIIFGYGISGIISSYTIAFLSARSALNTAFFIAAMAAVAGLVIIAIIKSPKVKEQDKQAAAK